MSSLFFPTTEFCARRFPVVLFILLSSRFWPELRESGWLVLFRSKLANTFLSDFSSDF